jgi:hypothetical protein
LPDVYIIQRNIGGKLNTTQTVFKKIEAILSSLDDTTITSKSIPLWYFSSTCMYSGFAYFSNQEGNFSIYVRVFDADSHITGRSANIVFNNTAGDIDIPTFCPTNAIPIPEAGKDTIVSINDTIRLNASAIDSFGGTITKWEWSFNGGDFFKSITGDTLIIAPADSNLNYYCVIRVMDNDKNSATDSMKVIVCKDKPVVDGGNDTTVGINAKVTLSGTATQQFGTIVMYKWDFNGDSIYDDSSATIGAGSYTYTHESTNNARFYVKDDDGNEATDIRIVTVKNNAPAITSIRPDTTISVKDSIALRATAIDIDGKIKAYAWDVDGNGVFEYTSATNPLTGFKYNTAGIYKAIIRITDDDNKTTRDTVVITVLQDAPVVNAGKDTVVSINDTIRLYGSASDGMGMVIRWEWDIGNTGAFVGIEINTVNSVKAPSKPCQKYLCILRVTDDDSNAVCDTVYVNVILDPPRANASALSTQVPVEYSIGLLGSARDIFGTIIKWEWDVGNTGVFIETTPDSNYTAKAPGKANEAYPCVLRVTDDDSVVGLDTVNINVNLFDFHEGLFLNEKNFLYAYPKDINGDGRLDFIISYAKNCYCSGIRFTICWGN